jgi:hypothetical protein
MSCPECALSNQAEFSAEMLVHHSGLKNLDKLGVTVFPKLLVCVSCGFSQFTIPEAELKLLAAAPPNERLTMAAAG